MIKNLKSVVLRCDAPEVSGRIYPSKLIKKAIKEDKVLQEKLANNCLFGDMFRDDIEDVDLSNVVFVVRKLYWYKNELKVAIDILDTPNGRLVTQCSTPMRVSILGIGDVDPNTNIVTSYKIGKFYLTW